MENNRQKVKNTSEFWIDYEGEKTVYFYYKWDSQESQKKLLFNEIEFLKKYVLLSFKYGILLPNSIDLSNYENKIEEIVNQNKGTLPENWISFNWLYLLDGSLANSSILFTQRNEKITSERILNIGLLRTFEQTLDEGHGFYGYPLHICFYKNYIYIYIDNNAFLLEIFDKNPDNIIDNSELAYLNSTRLNSFLRDFKKLCFEFGATTFEFENQFEFGFSEDGVLFGEEILNYEDVFDLLPEKHRYVGM